MMIKAPPRTPHGQTVGRSYDFLLDRAQLCERRNVEAAKQLMKLRLAYPALESQFDVVLRVLDGRD